MLHHRIRAVVLGGELAFLDQLDCAVDAGLHVPQGRGHHGVGVLLLRVDHVADGELAFFLGGIAHAKALGVEHVGALVDHGEGGFLGLGRVKPAVDERDGELDLGVRFLGARHEGVHQAIDFGDGKAAHHADLVGLGHAARDHAAEVGRLLDVVVEHAEVRRLRLARGTHQEGGLGKILGNLACGGFHAKHLAQDQLVAAGGVFAHHALVVGVADVFAGLVFDLAACFGGLQGLVDAADPLLFKRHCVDRRDLELGLREGQRGRHRHGGREGHGGAEQASGEDAASGHGGVPSDKQTRRLGVLLPSKERASRWRCNCKPAASLPEESHQLVKKWCVRAELPKIRLRHPTRVGPAMGCYATQRGPVTKKSHRWAAGPAVAGARALTLCAYLVPKIRSPASPRPGRM